MNARTAFRLRACVRDRTSVRFWRKVASGEVTLLRKLRGHDNVVTLLDVAVGPQRDAVFLVLEYAEHGDLGGLLDSQQQLGRALFDEAELKSLARQLLLALQHCHRFMVAHRDVKVTNLLYTSIGRLKLCDFGLARQMDDQHPDPKLTLHVVTLWYRAPELLLGASSYTTKIDLWAAGCVVAEIARGGKPLADGSDERAQLAKICDVLGPPSVAIWPDLDTEIPGASRLVREVLASSQKDYFSKLNLFVPTIADLGLNFLSALLCYDPTARATAKAALRHAWFDAQPKPKPPHLMPTFDPRRAPRHQLSSGSRPFGHRAPSRHVLARSGLANPPSDSRDNPALASSHHHHRGMRKRMCTLHGDHTVRSPQTH